MWSKGSNNINWRGGVSEYPDHHSMKKARAKKLKIVGGKCEDCGETTKTLQVHHLDGSKDNHVLKNLKILCPKCHGLYHRGKRKPKRKLRKRKEEVYVKPPPCTCNRCKYIWTPRKTDKNGNIMEPRWCPKCNSYLWNKPRRKK